MTPRALFSDLDFPLIRNRAKAGELYAHIIELESGCNLAQGRMYSKQIVNLTFLKKYSFGLVL